jgi:PKD repeat protein
VQLLASVPVDPVGGIGALGASSGEYREVMRYLFAPAAQTPTAATEFYIYVSHYKSGGTTTDTNDRGYEAIIIRTNEALSLPANARVIYVGDYNLTGSSEPGYQTIIAANSPNGIAQGQGVDPLNTSGASNINWSLNSLLNVKTEEDYSLHYRDDLQICTTNVYNGAAGGLALLASTYHAFGNNGTTAYESSVANGTDTALNSDLAPSSPIGAQQLYTDLVGASDHLPVVADYTIPIVQPVGAFTAAPTNGVVPLAVTFTDITTNGIVTNWFWTFGDGTSTNTTNSLTVLHTYTNAGVYIITETVTGPGGTYTSFQSDLITVLTPFQAWQLQYFGCTNCPQAQPGTDADGTGQDNLFKFVAGLNPTDATSVFVFSAASVPNQPAWLNLTYSPVVAGRTYTPLFSTNLTTAPWAPLTTIANPPVTNGLQVTLTDTNAGQAQKFYQIEISGP